MTIIKMTFYWFGSVPKVSNDWLVNPQKIYSYFYELRFVCFHAHQRSILDEKNRRAQSQAPCACKSLAFYLRLTPGSLPSATNNVMPSEARHSLVCRHKIFHFMRIFLVNRLHINLLWSPEHFIIENIGPQTQILK